MDYEYLLDIFENLPRKAKLLIIEFNMLEILIEFAIIEMDKNSPIEQIYFIALSILKEKMDIDFMIEPQYEIKHNNKKYFADFSISHYECFKDDLKNDFKLIIECDGYEFHQKTKEQVDYDNQREYDFKIEGFEILRFSGRQIYSNPMECAKKTIDYIIERNDLKNER